MPPVESEADRAAFFDADEFAQTATIEGVEVLGYLTELSETIDGLVEVPLETTSPTFLCQSANLPDEAVRGSEITIERQDGTTLFGEIVKIEPDGFGMTLLNIQDNG